MYAIVVQYQIGLHQVQKPSAARSRGHHTTIAPGHICPSPHERWCNIHLLGCLHVWSGGSERAFLSTLTESCTSSVWSGGHGPFSSLP